MWCHSAALHTLTGMRVGGHMIRGVSPIIFWFPHMCHLSVQLCSSGVRTIGPDCRRQKGIRHRRPATASPSLRCHRADVSAAWSLRLEDGENQSPLIIYSNVQVDAADAKTTEQAFFFFGRVTPKANVRLHWRLHAFLKRQRQSGTNVLNTLNITACFQF